MGSTKSFGKSRHMGRIRNILFFSWPGNQRDHPRLPSIVPYPWVAARNPISSWHSATCKLKSWAVTCTEW